MNNIETKNFVEKYNKLFLIGAIAALLAGILFRRNLAVEINMFVKDGSPTSIQDWFEMLYSKRLLALTYLHIFDLVNYGLLVIMFTALFYYLKKYDKSLMIIALLFALIGATVYFSTNTAFSMLSLSDLYMHASSDVLRNQLIAAGQSLLVINRFTSFGAHPGSGGLLSLLFLSIATLLTSYVIFKNRVFKRIVAYIGIIAGLLDLIYCLLYIFIPSIDSEKLPLFFIPLAGLFLMIWHILMGVNLLKLYKSNKD